MPLYEFIPLPIHFNFSSNVSIAPEVGATNMIAVGHSQSYQLLSSTDLQSCNKMGETYFCKGRNVLLTDLNKTCLGALYLADNKKKSGPMQVINRRSPRRDLSFGQQHICGVLPRENQ